MIYHAAVPGEWDEDAPEYAPGDYASDGFVHCSTAAQLETSVNRFLGDRESLVLLTIDDGLLGDELAWEPGSLGEPQLFPHLYAPVARQVVTRAEQWDRSPDGAYRVATLTTPPG